VIYAIALKPSAVKDLAALDARILRQIARRIDSLARDPRPGGAKKLEGADDLYRIRSGDYRVIYRIEDARILVLVLRVGHRRDVYRGL
jgi:mRNA interferase RelE/StbE